MLNNLCHIKIEVDTHESGDVTSAAKVPAPAGLGDAHGDGSSEGDISDSRYTLRPGVVIKSSGAFLESRGTAEIEFQHNLKRRTGGVPNCQQQHTEAESERPGMVDANKYGYGTAARERDERGRCVCRMPILANKERRMVTSANRGVAGVRAFISASGVFVRVGGCDEDEWQEKGSKRPRPLHSLCLCVCIPLRRARGE
jgi:hypothetical protein